MLDETLIKQLVEDARAPREDDTDFTAEARKAAARKMMSALKTEDEDLFLTALAELKDIDE